jgi:outer membrane murein-binding lipoprotein Lpp
MCQYMIDQFHGTDLSSINARIDQTHSDVKQVRVEVKQQNSKIATMETTVNQVEIQDENFIDFYSRMIK